MSLPFREVQCSFIKRTFPVPQLGATRALSWFTVLISTGYCLRNRP
jgi:hypothetical protein